MNDYAVDTAIAIKWVVSELDSADALEFLNESLHGGREMIRLDLLIVEAANVVWKYHRKKLLTVPEAHAAIAGIRSIPMSIEPADPLVDEALGLACTYGIAVYDALFVALVKKHGCDGITADEPLVAKVGKDFPSIKLLKNWQPSP